MAALLEAGADPTTADLYGETALHHAPDITCARLLLACDQDGGLGCQRSHTGRLARQVCAPAARAMEELEIAHGLAEWVEWGALAAHPTAGLAALAAEPGRCVGLEVEVDGVDRGVAARGVVVGYTPGKGGGAFMARLEGGAGGGKGSDPPVKLALATAKRKKGPAAGFKLFVHLEPGHTLSAQMHGRQLWKTARIHAHPSLKGARDALRARDTLAVATPREADDEPEGEEEAAAADESGEGEDREDVASAGGGGAELVPESWKDGTKAQRKAWRAAKRSDRAAREEAKELAAVGARGERAAIKRAKAQALAANQAEEASGHCAPACSTRLCAKLGASCSRHALSAIGGLQDEAAAEEERRLAAAKARRLALRGASEAAAAKHAARLEEEEVAVAAAASVAAVAAASEQEREAKAERRQARKAEAAAQRAEEVRAAAASLVAAPLTWWNTQHT